MLPRKTDQARHALQQHRAPLDMRQRRLLILCDGQRDLAALSALLGQDTPAMVIQLVQAGYLTTAATGELSATSAGTASACVSAELPPAAGTPTGVVAAERRRSLAAARIYVLGILEMQRHPHAAALFRDLQQSREETAVVNVMQQALQHLPGLTSPGYSERVRARLLEVLPQEHCAAFVQAA